VGSDVAASVAQIGGLAGPGTLEERLQAVRNKRTASRRTQAITLVAWIAGLAALLTVVGSSLLVH